MNRLYSAFKKYHKWPALIFTFFFISFAISGVLMNHRELISSIDVNRKYLPDNYRLKDWNLASVKGARAVNADSVFFFGGAGIWITNDRFERWSPFMEGIPNGSDRRKIFDFEIDSLGNFYAATRFGLYRYGKNHSSWQKCLLPDNDQFVTAIEIVDSVVYITTRNSLFTANLNGDRLTFARREILPPFGESPTISIFRLLWIIHSGEILGKSGRIVVDAVGIIMLFLGITGLIYFFFPKITKRFKGRESFKRAKRTTKFSYKWHLRIGAITALLLLIVGLTGIFLRPPFLLFVASGQISHSVNSPDRNIVYWHDKIRDFKFDRTRKLFLLATSDGIFFWEDLQSPLKKFDAEPPVSVMGINVFEILPNGDYLIGSFSGLFRWSPVGGEMCNYITGERVVPVSTLSSPFGSIAVSGYSKINQNEYVFDYNEGLISLSDNQPPVMMPTQIVDAFRFPLWNLAQEFHTCRIYSPVLSSFYILIVPLAGISLMVISITGFLMWNSKRKKKQQTLTLD